MTRRWQGIGVSGGIGVGRAHPLHHAPLPLAPLPIAPARVDEEIARFEQACNAAARELEDLRGRVLEALGGHYAGILEAQRLILHDPALVTTTAQRIHAEHVSARWALKEVVDELARRFERMGDPYLRERGAELADVHHRLQRLLAGGDSGTPVIPSAGPLVIVAHTLGPSDAVSLARAAVAGLVTETGGPTSHTAILAQALCLPAVLGLPGASAAIAPGSLVLVDGDAGEVVADPSALDLDRAAEHQRQAERRERALVAASARPAATRDGTEIALRATVEFPEEIAHAVRYGARGVGLYRSEFLFLSCAPHLPSEAQHVEHYVDLARRVAPEPCVVRTLDLGGEKYFHEVLGSSDVTPALGLRGVRLCLARPDIFVPQVRALLRAAALAENLRVMLPMVTIDDEVAAVRALLAREARALAAEGIATRVDVPLGVMIEVPAAAAAADTLARVVDFLSIGTNDLIQYSLAVDRGNAALAALYRPLHPGVLRLVRGVVGAAASAGVPLAVCGEMAAGAANVEVLVGLGVRELSVPPRVVPTVRDALRQIDIDRAASVVERLLDPWPPHAAAHPFSA
jgi:phosphotransferase system enzyme I (PtsI)